jgi:hypothetical protein
MKITGTPDHFGWLRTEKTRFLTLLRPDNFQGISINVFEERLKAFMNLTKQELIDLCSKALDQACPEGNSCAKKIAENLDRRRNYVNDYFRSMFKSAQETDACCKDTDYSAFGASFMAMHDKNK